jgi:hypothetical protein
MTDSHPLTTKEKQKPDTNVENPVEELKYADILYGEEEYDLSSIDSKEQIPLGIKYSKKEPIYRIKRRLSRLENVIEILPFWKNGFTVFTTTFSVAVIIILSVIVYKNFNLLPDKVPLFYNHDKETWTAVYDKSMFILIPLIVSSFNMMIIRLGMIIYNFDKKLVYFIFIGMNLMNVLLLIAFIQILYLVI